MYPVSQDFLSALRNSHTAISRVDLMSQGVVLVSDIPVIAGEVTGDVDALIRRRATLTLSPEFTITDMLSLLPPGNGGLWPLGNELKLYSGIELPPKIASTVTTYDNYLTLTGGAGFVMDTPDAAVLDLAGDVELIVDMELADWTFGAVIGMIVSKLDTLTIAAGGYSFIMASDTFNFQAGNGGTAYTATVGVPVPTSWPNGSRHRLRLRLDLNDGAGNRVFSVEESGDKGLTWAHLPGSPSATAGTISAIANYTMPLRVGQDIYGNNRLPNAKIYSWELRNGFSGGVVAGANYKQYGAGTYNHSDSLGNPFTMVAPAVFTSNVTTINYPALPVRNELAAMGVFRISKPTLTHTDEGLAITVEGFDRGRAASRNKARQPVSTLSGTSYSVFIQALIQQLLPWLDEFNFMDTSYLTPAIVFTPEEDLWKRAQDMATSIGAELFFDGDGVCVLREQPNPLYTPASFVYAAGEDATVTSIERSLDDEEAYNGVIFTSENSDLVLPLRSEVWDSNPDSPTYYDPAVPGDSLYGAVPQFISSQYITTQAQADLAAQVALEQVLGVIENISFEAVNNPAQTEGDVITVRDATIGVDHEYILSSLKIGLGETFTMGGTTRKRRAT